MNKEIGPAITKRILNVEETITQINRVQNMLAELISLKQVFLEAPLNSTQAQEDFVWLNESISQYQNFGLELVEQGEMDASELEVIIINSLRTLTKLQSILETALTSEAGKDSAALLEQLETCRLEISAVKKLMTDYQIEGDK